MGITAARMQSITEFEIHAKESLRVGLEENIVEDIRNTFFQQQGVQPPLSTICTIAKPYLRNAREIAIMNFAVELLESNTVCDETYNKSKKDLDGEDKVLVEITSIIGYYMYVALTLNVFKVPH